MAPLGIRDRLPLLSQLIKWFMDQGIEVDSPLFKLHHQASSVLIMLGFLFIAVENYLDKQAIICHNEMKAYPKLYCWIHGYSYIHPSFRSTITGESITGCFVDQSQISGPEDAPITTYYLWLPYLLSLLFLLSKLPHSLWKKYFEKNLMRYIVAGREETWELFKKGGGGNGGKKKGGGGGGDNNNKNNNNNQGEGKKNKNNNKEENVKKFTIGTPREIAAQFMEYRKRFTGYHINFTLCEFLNVLVVLFSVQITHWLLNHKFWMYGLEVLAYLHTYQEARTHNVTLHDPMCEVFPTEVSCTFKVGAPNGGVNNQSILCILGNNMFNQKFFFVLWIWWMFLLVVSVFGIFFRLLRISNPWLSKCLLLRKAHGNQFKGLWLSSGECFVLGLFVDNFNKTPTLLNKIFDEIAVRLEAEDLQRQDCGAGDGSYVPLINAPSPDHIQGSKDHSPGVVTEDKETFKVEKQKKTSINCESECRAEKTNAKKKKNKRGDRQPSEEETGGKTDSQETNPVVQISTNSEGIYSVIKSRSNETLV